MARDRFLSCLYTLRKSHPLPFAVTVRRVKRRRIWAILECEQGEKPHGVCLVNGSPPRSGWIGIAREDSETTQIDTLIEEYAHAARMLHSDADSDKHDGIFHAIRGQLERAWYGHE